jgi:2-polyprenyl-3-methyl-5-hydroxy-6-metoxy-1,4-benzoquinol methylase
MIDRLKEYYEQDAERFWNPMTMVGRDLDVYPLLNGLSGRLIEYGCGSGSLLLGLAREARFSHCTGVDLSENALKKLSESWSKVHGVDKGKLSLITPESDLLPSIPDASMDVLISVATVEHVVNPYVVLDELHRIAKPSSTLVCSVPNYAYLKHRLQLLFGVQPRTGTDEPVEKWRSEGWDGMHLHTFTKSSFEILLKDCRWEPQRWMGCGKRFNWTGLGFFRRRYPGMFSGELIACCRKM